MTGTIDFAKLRELEAKATPGKWTQFSSYPEDHPGIDAGNFTVVRFGATEHDDIDDGGVRGKGNAELIVALRNHAPALISRAEAAEEMAKALEGLKTLAIEVYEEWDKAPEGMRPGKFLLALAGERPGYRADIDAVHAALSKFKEATK